MDEMKKERMLEDLRDKAEEFLSLIERLELSPEAEGKVNQRVTVVKNELEKDVPDLDTLKDNLLMLQRTVEMDILPPLTAH